jgi:NADH-quinone oxidoreductase subunit C
MDATGLELIARDLREHEPEVVVETLYFRDRATLELEPAGLLDALGFLRERGYSFLASLHGVDYFPEEPRLGVIYELLDMEGCDRLSVKVRVSTDEPEVASAVELFPTANFQEREVYDMFGVVFAGHPNMRRILMPEDYEGFPQRRDFPIGGEPVLFTHNEGSTPGWFE